MRPSFFIQFIFILHCPSGFVEGRETKYSEIWIYICDLVYFWHNSPFWCHLTTEEIYIIIWLYFDFILSPFPTWSYFKLYFKLCMQQSCLATKSMRPSRYLLPDNLILYLLPFWTHLTLLSFTLHKQIGKSPIFPWTYVEEQNLPDDWGSHINTYCILKSIALNNLWKMRGYIFLSV